MLKKLLRGLAVVLVLALVAIQLVPYGRGHENPPARNEPSWDSPRTRALAVRACYDCHSNETRWPWYSHVAPLSWLVQSDVDDGRRHLNFSEMDRAQRHADEAGEEVREGSMPPWTYPPLHPDAHLTPAEQEVLARGLEATLGVRGGQRGRGGREGEREVAHEGGD